MRKVLQSVSLDPPKWCMKFEVPSESRSWEILKDSRRRRRRRSRSRSRTGKSRGHSRPSFISHGHGQSRTNCHRGILEAPTCAMLVRLTQSNRFEHWKMETIGYSPVATWYFENGVKFGSTYLYVCVSNVRKYFCINRTSHPGGIEPRTPVFRDPSSNNIATVTGKSSAHNKICRCTIPQ